MATIEHYMEQLNASQKEAVLENERPLLVLAGAGSGKTRVITTKIAYAIEVLKMRPWEILAVTFTNRAANEMRERVADMVDAELANDIQIRTFHSFGAWLLRRYGASINLSNAFTIYDDSDSLSLLASCLPNFKRSELNPIAKAISLAKDMDLSPDSDNLGQVRRDYNFPDHFRRYEERLRQVGNVDFADLIVRSIELLERDPHVLNQLHNRFRMILVDEYQDSNISQFKLLSKLVGPNTFICVVGDDDQSIYRFRGAEVENILSFPEVFPNTRIVKLERNYRSTANILTLASHVISLNRGRHPKTLWTEREGGEKSKLIYVDEAKNEAEWVANELKKSGDYSSSAVLYRTNAQSSLFETVFTQKGIPYKIVGALRFFEREEVKDALALLFLLLNRRDEVNFNRMVNKPPRGIGATSQAKIVEYAQQNNLDYIEALNQTPLTGRAAQGAKEFYTLYQEAEELIEGDNLHLLKFLLEGSNVLNYYQEEDRRNHTDRLDNLTNLGNLLGEYPIGREGLILFLESLTLDRTMLGKRDPADEFGVTLITMHNTKGLEFDRVFIVGLEEGLFPSSLSESDSEMEEERRIFYVAITRARNELFLLSSRRRLLWGRFSYQTPSRFIEGLPEELLEVEGKFFSSNNRFSALEERRRQSSPFRGGLFRGGAKVSLTPVKSFTQERRETSYSLGDRVYHDDFGEGEVQKLKEMRGKAMIEVRFGTGRMATFFTDTPLLEKLGSD